MTIEEVKKEVLRIIKESTETELKVTEETSLFADMGLASVEVVVMVGELEETFGIDISASCLRDVRMAGDLCNTVIKKLIE